MEIANLLQNIASKYDNLVCLYVFGSVARGDQNAKSDLDVAALFEFADEADVFESALSLHRDLSKRLKIKVDLLTLNSLKNIRLLEAILKEGVAVFERDKEQRAIFELSARHRIFDYQAYRRIIDAT